MTIFYDFDLSFKTKTIVIVTMKSLHTHKNLPHPHWETLL